MKMWLVAVHYFNDEQWSVRAAIVEAENDRLAGWNVLNQIPSTSTNWSVKVEEIAASTVIAIKRCYP